VTVDQEPPPPAAAPGPAWSSRSSCRWSWSSPSSPSCSQDRPGPGVDRDHQHDLAGAHHAGPAGGLEPVHLRVRVDDRDAGAVVRPGDGDDPVDHRGGQHSARGSAIGIAMTYSMPGTWGYSRSRSTTAVLVSGVWNSFINIAMPNCALRERLTWPRRSGATWGNGGPHGGSRWFHGKEGSPGSIPAGLHKADDQRKRWSSSHPGWLRPVGK
jgi:hypothetical protein